VTIARAFAIAPDEPFSALDELTARRLRLLLQALWLGEGHRPTGILVTHNMLEAAFLADRIYVMGGRPASFSAVIEVDLLRPRRPANPALFDDHAGAGPRQTKKARHAIACRAPFPPASLARPKAGKSAQRNTMVLLPWTSTRSSRW